jgi:hypothetical protein
MSTDRGQKLPRKMTNIMDIMLKRAHREYNNLVLKYDNVSFNDTNDKPVITVSLHNNNLSFILPSDYPFKPPVFNINNINHVNLYQVREPRILQALAEIKEKCMCCQTILCKWSPAIVLDDIINEYRKVRRIKKYILHCRILDVLNKNLDYCLPEEMIMHIWSFLYV